MANDTISALNAHGNTLVDCLQDVLVRAREVALHGIRNGAIVSLAVAQVRSIQDLRLL